MARKNLAATANARPDACVQHVSLQPDAQAGSHFRSTQNSRKRHVTNAAKRRGIARNQLVMSRLFVCLGLLLLLFTEIGCKKASAPQQGPLPVNVVTVIEKEVNEWDEFTGRLEAVESVEIRPRVSGYITEIHFEAGAIIKKGDLLYVIDPRPYQADFDRASAEFERTQAQLKLSQIELDRAKDGEKVVSTRLQIVRQACECSQFQSNRLHLLKQAKRSERGPHHSLGER